MPISFQLEPWNEVRRKIEAGEIDMTSMAYSAERAERVEFSLPHSVIYMAAFGRHGSPAYTSIADLKAHRVAMQKSSLMHDYVREQGLDELLVLTDSARNALALLEKGKVDFALGSNFQGRYWIKTNRWKNITVAKPRLMEADYCFAVPAGRTELLNLLNNGLMRVKESGEYREIYNHWLGVLDPEFSRAMRVRYVLVSLAALALLAGLAGIVISILNKQVKRRTAQLQLSKEALELFRFALDHATVGILWLNKDGSISYANEAACRNLGYSLHDLLGMSVSDIDPDVSMADWPGQWNRLMQEKEVRIETHHRAKDGRVFPVEVYANFIRFGDRELSCSFVRDVSERERAKQALLESRERLRTTLDSIGDAVISTDIEHRVVMMNPVAEAMTGWPLAEAAGLLLEQVFPIINETTRHPVENPVAKVLETGTIVGLANHALLLARDGREIPIADSAAPIRNEDGTTAGVVLVFRDQTQEQAALKALEESENRYRMLFENMTAGFAAYEMIYDEDGNAVDALILQANPSFEHQMGFSAEQLVGRRVRQVLPEIDPEWFETFAPVAQTGQPVAFERYGKLLDRYYDVRAFRLADHTCAATFIDITSRKQAEQQLEFERTLFRSFMDVIPATVYFKDRDGRFVVVNRHYASQMGMAEEDLIGKTDADLFPPEQARKKRQDEEQVMERGRPLRLEEQSGERWVYSAKAPRYDEAGAIVGTFGVSWDITAERLLKQALEKRILALTRPLGQIDDISFDELFDLEAIQRIQDQFSAATGVSSVITTPEGVPLTRPSNYTRLCGEIICKNETGCADCMEKHDLREHGGATEPVVESCCCEGLWTAGALISVGGRHVASWVIGQVRDGRAADEEVRAYAHKIGVDEQAFVEAYREVPVMSRTHFEEITQALHTLASQLSNTAYQNIQQARFIAEEKKRTEELRRLSAAIEQSGETVVITDLEAHIQYVNPAFEVVTGYSRKEALGQNPRILQSGQHDAAFYADLWDALTAGRIWTGRMVNKRKDGELFTEEATISPVRDAGGTIGGYVAVKRDITKELAREAGERQNQKLQSIGQLAGGVAHDFNNILQAILCSCSILRMDLDERSESYRDVDEIRDAALSAGALTKQLLSFSRETEANFETTDLNRLVVENEAMMTRIIGDNYRYVCRLADDLPALCADKGQLGQVLLNLVVNARDAMLRGGDVVVSTRCVHFGAGDELVGTGRRPGRFACLSVMDTGMGMSKAVVERLFEPYFTTKEVGKGTGLGLSVVYGIVKQHGGWIEVDSEVGRGSTLNVFLPVDSVESGERAPLGAERGFPPSGEGCVESVLVVEDDADLCVILQEVLGGAGYRPSIATSCAESFRLLEEHEPGFDLVICDVKLPDGNGLELAQEFKRRHAAGAVLLCSGHGYDDEMLDAVINNGFRYLEKPLSMLMLLRVVRELLDEKNGG